MRAFRTTTGRRVNILYSHTSSPVSPLRYFRSSLMMNIVTSDSVVCGFPPATSNGAALSNWRR